MVVTNLVEAQEGLTEREQEELKVPSIVLADRFNRCLIRQY